MIETVTNDAEGWSTLRTIDIPVLQSFLVRNGLSGQMLVLSSESMDGRSRLEATFLGVVDLHVSWTDMPDPLVLDVIDVSDVSAHGLENICFRVAEGAGFFSFSCSDFFAVAVREG